jgi:DNA-binding MarR family transcriptional regulator
VRRRLEERGFTGPRISHGFLVQRLVEDARPIGALARDLGVTQQAVSKPVAELERLGYVERRPGPGDGRVRLVGLTRRGRDAIAAARDTPAEVVA